MENQKPRLAVLSSRFPYPVEKGDKLRLYHQLIELAEDFDIYLFALTEKEVSPEEQAPIASVCREIYIYQDHQLFRKFRVLSHIGKEWPTQVRYFYSSEVHKAFLNDFFRINADVIYCQLYRMAPYLMDIQAPKVLDVMDSFASIATLHADHSRRWYDRIFWRRENRLIKQYEKNILDHFNHFTVISERDAGDLNFQSSAHVAIVRNGIDVPYFQAYPRSDRTPEYDMAFIGNLDYKPNREGVRYMIRQLLPYFRKMNREVKILIGGKGAENIERLYGDIPEISYHGWYHDIRDAYYAARIFIAPLFLGSGMQNKVLEALACSRPVICTSHVSRGMPMLQDNVYIADRPDEFFGQYNRLTQYGYSPEEQSRTMAVLKNELTWEAQCTILKKVLHDTRRNYEWDIARYH